MKRSVMPACVPVHRRRIPTPALASYAFARAKGSIMVTGSHIPFDWNGYKLNTSRGELLKTGGGADQRRPSLRVRERSLRRAVRRVPVRRAMARCAAGGPHPTPDGRRPRANTPAATASSSPAARSTACACCYQHSAVGRDLLLGPAALLRRRGRPGRPQRNVRPDRHREHRRRNALAAIQALLPDSRVRRGRLHRRRQRPAAASSASTARPAHVRFFPGDLVGMVVAEYLGADAVVVPISCNDAIDRGPLAAALEPKTRIGSPYVIAGMEDAARKGRSAVCGWEANGGFLVGSDIHRDGKTPARPRHPRRLPADPRDAFRRPRARLSLSSCSTHCPPATPPRP